MTTPEKLRRRKLRRAVLPSADFIREDGLLADAARLERSVEAFLQQDNRLEHERRALAADLTGLLESLVHAKLVIAGKLQRGIRAAGAINAYAKAGRA